MHYKDVARALQRALTKECRKVGGKYLRRSVERGRQKCCECKTSLRGLKWPNRPGGLGRCYSCAEKARYRILKETLIRIFGKRCQRCRRKFPPCVFDFHHLRKKTKGVAQLLSSGSVMRIAKEVMTCRMICANCHRIQTYLEN